MDEETEKGIKNLEELLYRLDQRAKDIQWYKERGWQVPPAAPSEPDEIGPVPPQVAKFMEKGPEKKAEAKPAEAPDEEIKIPVIEIKSEPAPEPIPELEPVKIPELQPAPAPVIAPEPVPAPVVKSEPAPAIEPLPVVAPLPELKPEPAPVPPPVLAPIPEPAPVPVPQPAALPVEKKPAKFSSGLTKKLLVILALSLAAAGGVYQFVLNTPRFRYAQAAKLMGKARYAEAVSAYSRIITQFPGTPQAAYSQYDIGDIKATQGNPEEAIERYQQFLKAAPEGDVKIAAAKIKIDELQRGDDMEIVIEPLPATKKLTVSPIKAALMGPAVKKTAEVKPAAAKPVATKPAAVKPAAPKPAAPKAAAAKAIGFSHERLNACNSVWAAERTMGRLDGNTAAEKSRNDCDGLKAGINACKNLQAEFDAIQSKLPGDRAAAKQQSDPSWTEDKQMAQDDVTIDAYEAQRCGDLMRILQD